MNKLSFGKYNYITVTTMCKIYSQMITIYFNIMDGKYYCKLIKYHRVANRYSATILMTKNNN